MLGNRIFHKSDASLCEEVNSLSINPQEAVKLLCTNDPVFLMLAFLEFGLVCKDQDLNRRPLKVLFSHTLVLAFLIFLLNNDVFIDLTCVIRVFSDTLFLGWGDVACHEIAA